MVEHWLHNSMVPGSNPGGDGIFFLSSYHFTTSLLTNFGSGMSMVPRWSGKLAPATCNHSYLNWALAPAWSTPGAAQDKSLEGLQPIQRARAPLGGARAVFS